MSKKKSKKYYAFMSLKTKQGFIYDDWQTVYRKIKKKPYIHKSFKTKQEAVDFLVQKGAKKHIVYEFKNDEKANNEICLLCGRPMGGTKNKYLCMHCKKRWKGMNAYLRDSVDIQYNVSQRTVLSVKHKYQPDDVFDFICNNPDVAYEFNKWQKKNALNHLIADRDSDIVWNTDFVMDCLSDDKKFISIKGEKDNPRITFECLRCNKIITYNYKNILSGKGHNCPASKSSGEAVVESFLKEHKIVFKTQFDTLVCRNPRTDHVMPYDIEIPAKKVLIEIQGKQHYEFIPYFHESPEAFEYQQFKDAYKKQFAEDKGYMVIYISYDDIDNGKYIDILNSVIYDI